METFDVYLIKQNHLKFSIDFQARYAKLCYNEYNECQTRRILETEANKVFYEIRDQVKNATETEMNVESLVAKNATLIEDTHDSNESEERGDKPHQKKFYSINHGSYAYAKTLHPSCIFIHQ